MKGLSRRDRRRATTLKRKEKDAEREQARSAGSKPGNRTETPAMVDGGSYHPERATNGERLDGPEQR